MRNKKPIQKLEDVREGQWWPLSEERVQAEFGVSTRVCFILAFKVTFSSLLPVPSPWFLELTDGAFKARAMGPRINFCSWNLLDVWSL